MGVAAVIMETGGADTGACGAGVLAMTGCEVVGTETGACSGDCTVGTETLGDGRMGTTSARPLAAPPAPPLWGLDGSLHRSANNLR